MVQILRIAQGDAHDIAHCVENFGQCADAVAIARLAAITIATTITIATAITIATTTTNMCAYDIVPLRVAQDDAHGIAHCAEQFEQCADAVATGRWVPAT